MEAKDTLLWPDEVTFDEGDMLRQVETTWNAAMAECARTHLKPDWKITAKDLKEAVEEARKAGRREVVDWLKRYAISISRDSRGIAFTQYDVLECDWEAKKKEWEIE